MKMNDENLKRTPLHRKHLELGAKMVPFGGWDMPVQYDKGILAEHAHTREKVSLFDISHMGEFRVKGPDAGGKLDRIFPRLVSNMKLNACRYNFLLTPNGTVVDDLVVYRLGDDEYYIVVNASTKDGDARVISENLPDDIDFSDESETTVKLDLQGPASADTLAGLGVDVADLRYFQSKNAEIASIPCLLSRTGYTGELGYEIYVSSEHGGKMWDVLLEREDVLPAGLGARDTLRLEMGYALYGHELDLETTPVEAGYGGMLQLSDDRDFIGRDALANLPPEKRLVPLLLKGRRAAREGSKVELNGKEIGVVTSGVFSPSLKNAIALAYVSSSTELRGNDVVEINASGKLLEAVVTELPFYKNGTARMKLT
jgi:aminomethyltransferase